MADDTKHVRDMDRILLRVPDGVKDRIAARARANGRSMNREIIELLAMALDETDAATLKSLRNRRAMLDSEVLHLADRLSSIQEQISALNIAIAEGEAETGDKAINQEYQHVVRQLHALRAAEKPLIAHRDALRERIKLEDAPFAKPELGEDRKDG